MDPAVWTPDAIVDAVLRIGLPAAIALGSIWLLGKFLEALRAKWTK